MSADQSKPAPGPIALFGSGEISPSGQNIFSAVLSQLGPEPEISILETPAGFELNSQDVAQKVADFLEHHLQNFHPRTRTIPARVKDGKFSTNNPAILQPLLQSQLIFMGPGSPTYAVRMLRDSLAWDYLRAAHRAGAGLAFSSAATIAVSSHALPVYEIYKAGQELHWKKGLNLLASYGLDLVCIPHWNNREGGQGLDTRRCFMGLQRFNPLKDMLPKSGTILGLDENTGLVIDFQSERCRVVGSGRVHLLTEQDEQTFPADTDFALSVLGDYSNPPALPGLGMELTEQAVKHLSGEAPEPDPEILRLVERRAGARKQQNWEEADRLRGRIEQKGWLVEDTETGPRLTLRNTQE
jgi:hypothetical protein